MNQWLYPVIVDRILIEDVFVDSEFKEPDTLFSVGIL